ncbi:hypothetical protein [Staphylococcus chromogenes]|uniref:hypothetical protein n=1 Tax=Staphylococcus chromogenes TaxID=46126 RepID=UPI003AFFB6B5
MKIEMMKNNEGINFIADNEETKTIFQKDEFRKEFQKEMENTLEKLIKEMGQ